MCVAVGLGMVALSLLEKVQVSYLTTQSTSTMIATTTGTPTPTPTPIAKATEISNSFQLDINMINMTHYLNVLIAEKTGRHHIIVLNYIHE